MRTKVIYIYFFVVIFSFNFFPFLITSRGEGLDDRNNKKYIMKEEKRVETLATRDVNLIGETDSPFDVLEWN